MSKKLYEKMNLYLANQEVAYIKLHNLHWYVKGRSFFTLHAKLEELYDQTAEIIDAVAERLLAVGQAPVANMKEALALATIKELADKPISSEETVRMMRAALPAFRTAAAIWHAALQLVRSIPSQRAAR